MAEQRININAQGYPVYTSTMQRGSQNEKPFSINSNKSVMFNTTVGDSMSSPKAQSPVFFNSNSYQNNIQYQNTSAYQVGQPRYYGQQPIQQTRQTIVNSPYYAQQQRYQQSRGPVVGTYDNRYVQSRPVTYVNASTTYGQNIPAASTNVSYGAYEKTNAYSVNNKVPMNNQMVFSQTSPVQVQKTLVRDEQFQQDYQHDNEHHEKCPKAVLVLLGFLALALIILGILLGLGVFTRNYGSNSAGTTNVSKHFLSFLQDGKI